MVSSPIYRLMHSVGCIVWRDGSSYQFVKDTLVQRHFGLAALELVVVVVLKAVGMGLELLEAVGVDVLDTVAGQQ